MSKIIDIMSLYPKDMNIYGDSGQCADCQPSTGACTVMSRLPHNTIRVMTGPEHVDLILGGGGQDTVKRRLVDDFYMRADLLAGPQTVSTPMLAICGLYQLFGEYFRNRGRYPTGRASASSVPTP